MGAFTYLFLMVIATTAAVELGPTAHFNRDGVDHYMFQTTYLTWQEAEDRCRRWGGHLVTITSQEQNEYLLAEMKKRGMSGAWIGFNDLSKEGTFEWTYPLISSGYTSWRRGEPNGRKTENCAELEVYGDSKGTWNDLACGRKMKSICQKTGECEETVDVSFLFDYSGSINDWVKIKQFVKRVANLYQFSATGSRGSIIKFSDHVDNYGAYSQISRVLKLNNNLTPANFNEVIDSIPQMGYRPRMDLGFKHADEVIFQEKNGARGNVKKIVYLITNGNQDSSVLQYDPAQISKSLYLRGIDIYAVGVGENVDIGQLEHITRQPNRVFTANSIKSLENKEFIKNISESCKPEPEPAECENIVDICFLLDSSEKLTQSGWLKMKEFVKKVANIYQFSETGAHGSIIVVGDNVAQYNQVVLRLDNNLTYADFGKAVDAMPYMGYRTRMDLGFKLANEVVFQERYGARGKHVKKIIILISDGEQTPVGENYDTVQTSQPLYERGVDIYAVSVSKNNDKGQLLQNITRQPGRVFYGESFDRLEKKDFVKTLASVICEAETVPVKKDECQDIVDICFMLDSSGSINKYKDWVEVKDFVRRLSQKFQFSPTRTRGSIIVFSDFSNRHGEFSKVVSKFNSNMNTTEFGKAIDSTPYIGFRTRIDLGFKLADNVVFQERNGARPGNVKKVIVLIADGKQNPSGPNMDPIAASKSLYLRGVDIYALGIGNNVDLVELQQITRNPSRVFIQESFESLQSNELVNNIVQKICEDYTELELIKPNGDAVIVPKK